MGGAFPFWAFHGTLVHCVTVYPIIIIIKQCPCHVPVHPVDAGAPVETGAALTLIDVDLTVQTFVSRETVTCVQAQVVVAGGAILAGSGDTLVYL